MRKRLLLDAALVMAGLSIVYLGMCVFLFFKQDSYIYFPEKTITATPGTYRVPYEERFALASDGVSVNYWLIRAGDPSGAVVFAHGNGGNLSDRVEKYILLSGMGLDVYAFDYRGYGKSGGEPSEEGFYRDMEAVVSEAVKDGHGERIIMYGESIGGAVAARAAAGRACAGLVLESSFTTAADMAGHYYPLFPVGMILRSGFDALSSVRSCDCPVLVLHSPDDDIVPYRMGRELMKAAGDRGRFFDLKGGHNDGGIIVSPGASEKLREFAGDVLPERVP
ncbi:MAG TPA: alpha/beta hydrolase [Acidobacteriota bacterium]|nr:alpha/beta hydrolase [Acidobacteriota bacterium]